MKRPQIRMPRCRVGALLLGVCCLFSAVKNCRDAVTGPPVYDAGIDITSLESELSASRPLLAHMTQVGFITDARPGAVMKVSSDLVATQYMMYPVIVRPGADERFVLGWFHGRTPNPYRDFKPVANYGGIVLFERVQP